MTTIININNTNSELFDCKYKESNTTTTVAQQALATQPNLSTPLWEHTKSRLSKNGGVIHQFCLVPSIKGNKYNTQVAAHHDTSFPALEFYPDLNDIDYLVGSRNQIAILIDTPPDENRKKEFLNLLEGLGYSCYLQGTQIYTTLPDAKTLQGYLQNSPSSYFRNLKIQTSHGISSDREFIELFFESDCLLSDGIEFVHDHAAHLIILLSVVIEERENYSQFKEKIRTMVRSLVYEPLLWNTINTPHLNYDAMWAFLGKIIDVLQAMNHAELKEMISQKGVAQFDIAAILPVEGLSDDWEKYFKKRFLKIDLNYLKMQWYLMLTYYFASQVGVPQARIDTLLQQTPYSLKKVSWLPQMFFFLYNNQTKILANELDEFMVSLKEMLDQSKKPDFL